MKNILLLIHDDDGQESRLRTRRVGRMAKRVLGPSAHPYAP